MEIDLACLGDAFCASSQLTDAVALIPCADLDFISNLKRLKCS